jgi:hypothetical protein
LQNDDFVTPVTDLAGQLRHICYSNWDGLIITGNAFKASEAVPGVKSWLPVQSFSFQICRCATRGYIISMLIGPILTARSARTTQAPHYDFVQLLTMTAQALGDRALTTDQRTKLARRVEIKLMFAV